MRIMPDEAGVGEDKDCDGGAKLRACIWKGLGIRRSRWRGHPSHINTIVLQITFHHTAQTNIEQGKHASAHCL